METIKISNSSPNHHLFIEDEALGRFSFEGEIEELNLEGSLKLSYGKRVI